MTLEETPQWIELRMEVWRGIKNGCLVMVTARTRAGRNGRRIFCARCSLSELVYHFKWSGLSCMGCEEIVPRDEWVTAAPKSRARQVPPRPLPSPPPRPTPRPVTVHVVGADTSSGSYKVQVYDGKDLRVECFQTEEGVLLTREIAVMIARDIRLDIARGKHGPTCSTCENDGHS